MRIKAGPLLSELLSHTSWAGEMPDLEGAASYLPLALSALGLLLALFLMRRDR